MQTFEVKKLQLILFLQNTSYTAYNEYSTVFAQYIMPIHQCHEYEIHIADYNVSLT